MHWRAPAVIALLVVAFAGCGEARRVDSAAPLTCTSCHFGGADGATGAHAAHVRALSGDLSCRECHPDARTGSTRHRDSSVEIVFGLLATRNGALASRFDSGTKTCTAVYCHGDFDGGNAVNAPVWRAGPGDGACGSCHGTPPAPPHPQHPACENCHEGYTITRVNLETHVNGNPDFLPLTCHSCHGSVISDAPPTGTLGETEPSTRAVGAHQAHLVGGTLGAPLACDECHPIPTDVLHADGTRDVVWGPLATHGGAAPEWRREDATCASTYCHGNFIGGNTANAPVWTKVDGTQAACGICHGTPPAPPHPQHPACENCHEGYTIASVNLGTHVNGKPDFLPLTCHSCHGSVANDAPPLGTAGETEPSARAVGAHQAHLAGGTLGARVACGECHPVPTDVLHADGTRDVVWGPLATRGGAAPEWRREGGTCASTYCHGNFRGGNTANAPVWTKVDGTQRACGACHGAPPPAPHPVVVAGPAACSPCHSDTVDASGAIVPHAAGGKHLDGTIQSTGHGPEWRDPASGDFHASAARTRLGDCKSCHGQDLGGGSSGAACAECHGSGGQLLCTSCHGDVASGTHRSTHLAGAATPSGDCRACHDASPAAIGHFELPPPGGSFPDAQCVDCHDGSGQGLGGRTPPLLVRWYDTVAGDWHGARAGTGSSGTLRAPYVRGQGPLPCTACHDQHASGNAFLLRSTVNGVAIPAGAIDRAGVGGELLCVACHEGPRHGSCSGCHGVDPEPNGRPCFWCHGHEGIVRWYPADSGITGCDACHELAVTVEYDPPPLSQSPAVWITATSATFRWSTSELATSYVEYGVTTVGSTAGDYALSYSHVVTLTGLSPSTTYAWRVRSSDALRNVTRSELRTFTTFGLDEVPTPLLGPAWASATAPSTTGSATVRWYPVTAPSGTAVEYQVQLAGDPVFTVWASSSLNVVDGGLATGTSEWVAGTPITDGAGIPARALTFTVMNLPQGDCDGTIPPTQYWIRVRARDQTGVVSGWSATGTFTAIAEYPYYCDEYE